MRFLHIIKKRELQYSCLVNPHVSRRIDPSDGALCVNIRMNLTRIAGEENMSETEIAAQIERACVDVLLRLRAAGSDAVGFGRLAIRKSLTISEWERQKWPVVYETLPVRVSADVKVL